MYLIEDNKCIYNDNIICTVLECEKCDNRINRLIRKQQKIEVNEQLNIFDFINKERANYANSKRSNR